MSRPHAERPTRWGEHSLAAGGEAIAYGPLVRRACIDIGSNTTRLLVADCTGEGLVEVHQEKAFTKIGHDLRRHGEITSAKIAEVVEVVAAQLQTAQALGATEAHGVATAAIRHAANGAALVEAIGRGCGVKVAILSGAEEARLAFVGAARTLGHAPAGTLGVVDVGGGSSELVVGTVPDNVSWCTSFGVGSGHLTDGCLRSDPPSSAELAEARALVAESLEGVEVPHPAEAVAVGGSATSLRRLAGPLLDPDAFGRTLQLLASERRAVLAGRFELDPERVRLLPAGLLILQAASELFGTSLQIARGGVREGVLLEAGS
jgi:exopolyphosphatase / guanosine-5'-triphosphate,3'-diphosphate pyrophosphatase